TLSHSHILYVFIIFLITTRPPRSTLFPYTTLFRSLNKIVYIYYYRNEYIMANENLELEFRGKTIDTVSIAQLDIGINKSKGQRKDRKSTRLNSSHVKISYAVFCLKKKTKEYKNDIT